MYILLALNANMQEENLKKQGTMMDKTLMKQFTDMKNPFEKPNCLANDFRRKLISGFAVMSQQFFLTTIILYFGLCLFRILNTFAIQSYFDPDEYWQTLEPAYCEVFTRGNGEGSSVFECPGYTWEWRRRATETSSLSWLEQCLQGPIRSYISVLPTYAFYSLLQRYHLDTHFWVSQGPKILMAVVAAAPTDLAIWTMAHWLPVFREGKQSIVISSQKLPWWCLFCSLSSWLHGYALIRTFSNSLETMLLSVSVALVAPELLGGSHCSPRSTLRHSLAFLLGGFSVAMRFSGATAWIPMGILLALHRYSRVSQSGYYHQFTLIMSSLVYLVQTCAFFGALGIGAACLVDRYFYGFWTIPLLGSFHFNVLLGNSSLYGSHPWHWYLSGGIPAIAGLLIPFLVWDIGKILHAKSNMCKARRNVWIIIMVYTLAHSMSRHKEFRFVMPILPLFCLLAGSHVRSFSLMIEHWSKQRRKSSPSMSLMLTLTVIFVLNLLVVLYLGLFHQSAPISVNHKISLLSSAVQSHQQTSFTIHYLTGACHSTPLHSYLHVPGPLKFETWSLDCSPECRSRPDILCESEQFAKNPAAFVDQVYFKDPTCSQQNPEQSQQESSCVDISEKDMPRKSLPPDFLVTFPDYATKIKAQIDAMGLVEVARFSHGINGLRINRHFETGDGYKPSSDGLYRRITLFGEFLELSIDEMVLYASPVLI